MTDPNFYNPLLDDDDDEYPTQPVAPGAQPTAFQRPIAPVVVVPAGAPKFGELGFGKGVPKPHKGSPRSRLTAVTAPLLAHVAKFPGSTAEAASMVSVTQAIDSLGHEGGALRAVPGALRQLKKLEGLGLVNSYTPKGDNVVTHWGATERGVEAVQQFGYLLETNEGSPNALMGMSYKRLNHYRYIGLVAAQFACPEGPLREALKLEPVKLGQLVSEPQIRRDFASTVEWMKDRKAQNKDSDHGRLRGARLQAALAKAEAGTLEWADLILANPTLRVAGLPASEFGKGKSQTEHIPDLVVNLDETRTGRHSDSIMVEVELSRKGWEDYEALFRVYKHELSHRAVYSRIVYFTQRPDIAKFMRKVDKSAGTGLFESGRLVVLPLVHRNGEPVKIKQRIGD